MKKFNYGQENVLELSQDIVLVKDDIHIGNNFYGNSSILKKKSILPFKYTHLTIEHGIMLHEVIWWVDKNSQFKTALVSSPFREKVYKNQTNKYVFNIGLIINYIRLKNIYKPEGSIYFLPHSTHEVEANLNLNDIVCKLKSLSNDVRPEYICVYWKDILLNKHEIFIKNGFKVVTAGHIYDNLFLYRLKEILLNFKIMVTSEIGSHVFYAHSLGLEVIVPKELTECFYDEKFLLSEFYNDSFERKYLEEELHSSDFVNKFFIKVVNSKDNLSLFIKDNFYNYYGSNKKLSRLKLTLIFLFSWLFEKVKPKGFMMHVFDYSYIRINRWVSK